MRTRRTKIWAAIAAISMVAVVLPVSSAAPVAAAGPTVFINEIHYDNDGGDVGEAFEIAGPAGTDLADWSVVLYNGSGGAPYNTIGLAGVIADQQGGFGTVSFSLPSNGLQNGAPDGLALLDPIENVIEFLSYEGSFTAVGGQADGAISTDIGVFEPGSTPIGHSLQLTGTGTMGGDFTWAEPQANTFGTVNTGQTFGGGEPPAPSVVINEVDYDQPGTDTAEFFELTNNGSVSADLSGWVVELVNGSNDTVYDTIALPAVTLEPGDYFVVCANAATVASCELDDGPDENFLQNGAPDAVGLRDATGELVDAVSYEGDVAGYTEGSGAGLVDNGSPGADDQSISRCPDGVDTDQNNVDFVGERPVTPGAPNSCGDEPPAPCESPTAIADVQGPGDVTPFAGEEVSVQGIVTADGGDEIVIQEAAGGPRSGITVFSPDNAASIGDEVCVTGTASEPFEQTQVSGSVEVLSSGNALPAVALVTTSTVATGSPVAEDYESVLVRVENVTVTDITLGFGEFAVDDGSGATRFDDKYFAFTPSANQMLDFVQGPLSYSFGSFKIEPRDADDIGVAVVVEVCGDPATFVHDIQGSGAASPLVGQTVSIEGVVVGDFQDDVGTNGDLNGFFVQEEEADADADPATSEGIFVFQGSDPEIDVAIGDVVRVTGSVSEFNDSTQITSFTGVLACGLGVLPAPTELTLPFDSLDDLESVEHMYVTLPQRLAIVEFFNFDRFGEIVVATERLYQPTAVFEPGSAEAAELAELNDRSKITIDDGRTAQNPDPAIHPNGDVFDLDNRFRGGDLVANATGVLNYAFGLYRIQPTQGADYEAVNPRDLPEAVGGNVTVASFNVLNYFNTLDTGANICGPDQSQGCRGANDANERERQLTKIVAAISELDADVVGIIEVENTAGVEAMADIVAGLNAIGGEGTYDYIATGTVGDDVIKVGFLYQPGEVTPIGDYAVLDDPAFVAPSGEPKNRAALAQTFQDNETGGVFTAAVNHLKSKGSGCGAGDDDPEAGNCNLTRTIAAQLLAEWLAGDPTGSGDPDVLIIGDLNSYDKEDPIDALKAAGYTDLLDVYQGEFAYSYLFSGELGYLDYAMANTSLAAQVTGATAWHSNSDEPDILDYDTSFKKDAQDALYEPNPYRASDHDAVLVGLDVCDSVAPSIEVMLSRTLLFPPNGKYRNVEATVVVSDNFDDDPTVRLVSVTSDEPDNGDGDGDSVNDIVVVDDDSFRLRAERSGSGDGRTYTVTYEVEDDCGNTATASATVEVPINNSDGNKGNKKFR